MVFAVFIQTPPINEFEISLFSRSIESLGVIKMRILEAKTKLTHVNLFAVIIDNNQVDFILTEAEEKFRDFPGKKY